MYVFFGTGTLAILFSWGGNFLILNNLAFDFIPFFNKFRAPETWLVLTAFCYTVVAVYGLQWFLDFIKQKSASLKDLYLPLGVLVGIFALITIQVKTMDFTKEGEVQNIANQIAQQNQVSPENPQVLQRATTYVEQNFIPDRKEAANSDLFRFGLLIVVGGALIWFTVKQKISTTIASIGFILIAGFDLTSVGKRYVPDRVIVNGNVSPERVLESKKRDIDQFIIDNIESENKEYKYRVFPLLVSTFQEATPSYFYPTIGGYTGAKLSIVSDLQQSGGPLYKGKGGLNLNLLGALNIKYINYQPGLQIQGLTQVYSGNSGAVYENQKLLPKAYFVDSLVIANSAQQAYSFIENPDVDYSKVAVVETSESIISSADSLSSAVITNYTGQNISINTSRSKPGFLILSEIYYPAGWIAKLDGEEIPIYKANYVLRGLQIPEGEHVLELEFKPKSFYLGVTIGWISLGLQILLGLIVGFNYIKTRSVT